jgi:hypothetical protein
MTVASSTPLLAAQIFLALVPVRTRGDAAEAVSRVAHAADSSPHALRRALASITTAPATARELSFPALEAARELLDRVDETLDRIARAAVVNNVGDDLARELAFAAGADRLDRTLSVAFDALGPPASRARAVMVDLLRAHSLGAMRSDVYAFLVSRDTDIRIPLADDAYLSADERLDLLGRFARRLRTRGKRIAPAFDGARAAPLLHALADWPRYASHPRQLLFAFERAVGDAVRAEEIVRAFEVRALPVEVRHWLAARTTTGPLRVTAHAIGVGHYECARCGADALLATSTRRITDENRRATETTYTCASCNTPHHSSWDDDSLVREPVAPSAWIETG